MIRSVSGSTAASGTCFLVCSCVCGCRCCLLHHVPYLLCSVLGGQLECMPWLRDLPAKHPRPQRKRPPKRVACDLNNRGSRLQATVCVCCVADQAGGGAGVVPGRCGARRGGRRQQGRQRGGARGVKAARRTPRSPQGAERLEPNSPSVSPSARGVPKPIFCPRLSGGVGKPHATCTCVWLLYATR